MRVYLLFLLLIPVRVGLVQRKLPLAIEEEEKSGIPALDLAAAAGSREWKKGGGSGAGLAAVSQESKALCIPQGTHKYYIYLVLPFHLKMENFAEYLKCLTFKKPTQDPKPVFLETPSVMNCVMFCSVWLCWCFFKGQWSYKIFLLLQVFHVIGFNMKFWFVLPFDSPFEWFIKTFTEAPPSLMLC